MRGESVARPFWGDGRLWGGGVRLFCLLFFGVFGCFYLFFLFILENFKVFQYVTECFCGLEDGARVWRVLVGFNGFGV